MNDKREEILKRTLELLDYGIKITDKTLLFYFKDAIKLAIEETLKEIFKEFDTVGYFSIKDYDILKKSWLEVEE